MQMSKDRIVPLREMLKQIDGRLLAILTAGRPLDDESLGKVAILESARGAVQRLLDAAETEGLRLEAPAPISKDRA